MTLHVAPVDLDLLGNRMGTSFDHHLCCLEWYVKIKSLQKISDIIAANWVRVGLRIVGRLKFLSWVNYLLEEEVAGWLAV